VHEVYDENNKGQISCFGNHRQMKMELLRWKSESSEPKH